MIIGEVDLGSIQLEDYSIETTSEVIDEKGWATIVYNTILSLDTDKIEEVFFDGDKRASWLRLLGAFKYAEFELTDLEPILSKISTYNAKIVSDEWNAITHNGSKVATTRALYSLLINKGIDVSPFINQYKTAAPSVVIDYSTYKAKHIRVVGDVLNSWEDTEWLIDGLLPAGELGWIIASPAATKSLMSLLMSMKLALSNKYDMWFGPCQIKRQVNNVMYITLEDSERQLRQRIVGLLWTIHEESNVPLEDLQEELNKHFWYSTTTEGGPFIKEKDSNLLLTNDAMMHMQHAREIKATLVVLDTLTTHTAVEENRNELRGEAMVLYKKCFIEPTGATFVVLHHVPLQNSGEIRGRGASAQTAAIRFEYTIERQKDFEVSGRGKIFELKTGKNNLGLFDFKDIFFRLYTKKTIVNKDFETREVLRYSYEREWKQQHKIYAYLELFVISMLAKDNKVTTLELNELMLPFWKDKNKIKTNRKTLIESGIIEPCDKVGTRVWWRIPEELLAKRKQEQELLQPETGDDLDSEPPEKIKYGIEKQFKDGGD